MNRKTRTNERGLSVFFEVFNWFDKKMNIFGAENLPYADAAKNEKKIAARLLGALGTGITNISYERVENMEEILPKRILDEIQEEMVRDKNKKPKSKLRYSLFDRTYELTLSKNNELIMNKLVFIHGNPNISFDMEEESAGTQRLYNLLSMIMSKAEDNVYILDELDIRLHPRLSFKFVELFLKEKIGTKNQLIFTTHES
jgi:AAA15 family ATPase/GTPase